MKQSTLKLGKETGSVMNHIMSNNESLPEVGKGATVLHWTDRTCYEVLQVSTDGKTATLERLEAYANPDTKNDYGHENWLLKPTGIICTIVWYRKKWCFLVNEIVFTDSFIKEMQSKGHDYTGLGLRKENPELADKIYNGNRGAFPGLVVEGVTRLKKKYNPVNILFGVKDYHYDWTF